MAYKNGKLLNEMLLDPNNINVHVCYIYPPRELNKLY